MIRVRHAFAVHTPHHVNVRLHPITRTLAPPDVAGGDHHRAKLAPDEIGDQAPAQLTHDVLVPLVRRGSHVQNTVNDLVSLPVVRQRVEHLDIPVGNRCGHGHKLKHSAGSWQDGITYHAELYLTRCNHQNARIINPVRQFTQLDGCINAQHQSTA